MDTFLRPIVIAPDEEMPEFSVEIFNGTELINEPSNIDQSDRRENLIRTAEAFLSIGYIPIPLQGKVPVVSNWQNTRPENAIAQLHSRKFNNLGLLTGRPSNLTIVDIDDGYEAFTQILNDAGLSYPNTYRVRTGRGGMHLYFKYAGDELLSAPLRQYGKRLGIDIRNNGGQIVAPGSIHPETGRLYEVENIAAVIEMPATLKAVILEYMKS